MKEQTMIHSHTDAWIGTIFSDSDGEEIHIPSPHDNPFGTPVPAVHNLSRGIH